MRRYNSKLAEEDHLSGLEHLRQPCSPQRRVTQQRPGTWARKVTPHWAYSVYDVADRMRVSVRWVRVLLNRYGIPVGRIRRIVRLSDGGLRVRYLTVITPTGLRSLLIRHAGLGPNRKPLIRRR